MAYETGVASDPLDLIEKIRTFLTTNAELVGNSEEWVQIKGNTGALASGDRINFKSTGPADDQEIFFGIRAYINIDNDQYSLDFWGHAVFDDVLASDAQPYQSKKQAIPLWNNPMNYWLIANGRRWMLGVEVSTTWQTAHCGLLLPIATPDEYSYPFFVAGMSDEDDPKYSSVDERHRFFASPGYDTAEYFTPDNTWVMVNNYSNSSTNSTPFASATAYMYPTRYRWADDELVGFKGWSDQDFTAQGVMIDGSYYMNQLIVMSKTPSIIAGIVEGAFWVSGRFQAPGNTITDANGDNHIVFQNGARNTARDFMTLRLK